MFTGRLGRFGARRTTALFGAVIVGATLMVGITQTSNADAATAIKAGCGKTTLPWFWGNTAHYFVGAPYEKNSPTARVCTPDEVKAAGGNGGIISYVSSGGNAPTKAENAAKPAIKPYPGIGTDATGEGTLKTPFPANPSLLTKPIGCRVSQGDGRWLWKYLGKGGKGPGWYLCADSQKNGTAAAGTGGGSGNGGPNTPAIDAQLQHEGEAAWSALAASTTAISDTACPVGYGPKPKSGKCKLMSKSDFVAAYKKISTVSDRAALLQQAHVLGMTTPAIETQLQNEAETAWKALPGLKDADDGKCPVGYGPEVINNKCKQMTEPNFVAAYKNIVKADDRAAVLTDAKVLGYGTN